MTNKEVLNLLDINEVADNGFKELLKLLESLSNPLKEVTLELQMCGIGCAVHYNEMANKFPDISKKYDDQMDRAYTKYYQKVQAYQNQEFGGTDGTIN